MKLVYSIIYVLFIGAIAHFSGAAVSRENYHFDRFPYKPFAWEKGGRIYDAIGIRRWKEKMPDTSKYSRLLVTKEVRVHMDAAAIRRMIQETCVAEQVHTRLCLASIGVILIWESGTGFFLWLLCILGNLPYILIQRYNRPQLVRLLEMTERRQARLQKNEYIHYVTDGKESVPASVGEVL